MSVRPRRVFTRSQRFTESLSGQATKWVIPFFIYKNILKIVY